MITNNPIEIKLHHVLKLLREQQFMTREKLAHKIGISQGTITEWESGRIPKLPEIETWANALGYEVEVNIKRKE
jgi:transcriptional regulator with XRE-family HTH domain